MPKPVNSGTISSTSRKIVSANQNNVINGQSNIKANSLDAGPSNSPMLFSSLFTDTEPLIRPPVPASSSQKQTEIQEKATPDSNISNASKENVPLPNIAEESTLSKRQLKKRRKKATEEILSNSSESPLTKCQRKSRRKKIKKAEKLRETTQMFLKVLNGNST